MQNVDVIKGALQLLGVLHVGQPVSADDGALGLTVMNAMLAEWEEDSIDIGYFEQDDIDAESPVEMPDLLAVQYNLAVYLAPQFGRTVTPEVGGPAGKFHGRLKRDAAVDANVPVDTSGLPSGEGQGGTFDIVNG